MDDFSKIFSVVAHFREWKYNFPTSYNQAYISLCLPKLLAPYVSLQLASWNPLLAESNTRLENMSWLQDLLFFEYHSPEINSTNSDLQLIPHIVESVVIPKLRGTIVNFEAEDYEIYFVRFDYTHLGSTLFYSDSVIKKLRSAAL